MGPKLGEILIAGRHLSPADLKRALDAQLASGGRLGTNLLELGLLDEETLSRVLQEQKRVDVATRRMLDEADPRALRLVPGVLAARHEAVPFSLDGHRLKVAMVDPTDAVALDELAFATGCEILPHIAPETRVRGCLEKLYGVAPAGRGHEPAPSAASPSPADTARRLSEADTREDVGEALLALAATAFPRAFLWLVRPASAMGWMSHAGGPGREASRRQARQASARLDDGSLMSEAVAGKHEVSGRLDARDGDAALASVFGAPPATEAVLLPVLMGDRVVMVVQGDPGQRGADASQLAELRKACAQAALAMEVLLLRSRIRQGA